MARIRYGVFLLEANHCYVITNADTDYAETDTDEVYLNPSIQMSLPTYDESLLKEMFSVEYDDDPKDFKENLLAVIQDKLPGWKLTGVNINADGVYLIYHYVAPDDLVNNTLWNTGTVFVCGEYDISFVVNCKGTQPVKRYDVSVKEEKLSNKSSSVTIVHITEYVNSYKHRTLEFRSDNHNRSTPIGQQYCIITEY